MLEILVCETTETLQDLRAGVGPEVLSPTYEAAVMPE